MNKRECGLIIAAACGWSFPVLRRSEGGKERKCLLPGCNKMTTHNGGYCCADHCRDHRRIRKDNANSDRTDEGGSVQ